MQVSGWGLVALTVALVVAVLGLRAVATAYRSGQEIEHYANVRSTAVYFVENGKTVSRDMRRLNAYNHADLVTMRQAKVALAVRDASTYNSVTSRMNARSGAQRVHRPSPLFSDLSSVK